VGQGPAQCKKSLDDQVVELFNLLVLICSRHMSVFRFYVWLCFLTWLCVVSFLVMVRLLYCYVMVCSLSCFLSWFVVCLVLEMLKI